MGNMDDEGEVGKLARCRHTARQVNTKEGVGFDYLAEVDFQPLVGPLETMPGKGDFIVRITGVMSGEPGGARTQLAEYRTDQAGVDELRGGPRVTYRPSYQHRHGFGQT